MSRGEARWARGGRRCGRGQRRAWWAAGRTRGGFKSERARRAVLLPAASLRVPTSQQCQRLYNADRRTARASALRDRCVLGRSRLALLRCCARPARAVAIGTHLTAAQSSIHGAGLRLARLTSRQYVTSARAVRRQTRHRPRHLLLPRRSRRAHHRQVRALPLQYIRLRGKSTVFTAAVTSTTTHQPTPCKLQ